MRVYFFLIFIVGLTGIVINKRNLISLLMSLELIILATFSLFLYSSNHIDDLFGDLYAFLILLVAASESAIGLSIVASFFRVKGEISLQFMSVLKG